MKDVMEHYTPTFLNPNQVCNGALHATFFDKIKGVMEHYSVFFATKMNVMEHYIPKFRGLKVTDLIALHEVVMQHYVMIFKNQNYIKKLYDSEACNEMSA